ncbi:MAG: diacylglycerol kinase family lipid kinase [Clostridia bacterium]|nr:diacylglycerol kinase family lipid kinase [Clostridia bacterium]
MRHIFVINPRSGPQDVTETVERQINALRGGQECEVYVTRGPGDATDFVRKTCREDASSLRFYACGGDGTLNEAVNGAAGFAHAAVGCYPCGSGNDFVKYFGGKRPFLDLAAQLEAPAQAVDLIRVNDRYSINVVNLGFEAKAAARMISFRRFPLLRGHRSYYGAVVATLIDGRKNRMRIVADGETLADGKILLCTMANGEYVGGSFRCAPRARVDDGLLEVCCVSPLSVPRFGKLIGFYQRGEHLDNPAMKNCITYRRARKLEVSAPKDMMVCLDGEIITGKQFTIENVPGAMRFIVPRGAEHTGRGIDMSKEAAK